MAGSSYTESSVKTYVDTRFNAATAYADAAKTTLNDFLTELSSKITSFTGTPIDFSTVPVPGTYTPSMNLTGALSAYVSVPDFPSAPALSALPAAPTADAGLGATAVPAAMEDALLEAITSGKLLSDDAEKALYDRAIARKDLENERLENAMLNTWASRGFEIPSDVLLAQASEVQKEQTRTNLEISSEILAKSSELAVQATAGVIQGGISWLQLRLGNIENLIRGFQAEAGSIIQNAQAKISLYQQQAAVSLGLYGQNLSTMGDIEKLKLAGNDNAIKNAISQREAIIKQAEAQLRESANLLNIQLDSLKAGAQVNAQIVASALSSYNSSVSYGFSGGWNDNYSTDNTKAIVSESIQHNLTE